MLTALTDTVKDHFTIKSKNGSEGFSHNQPFVIGKYMHLTCIFQDCDETVIIDIIISFSSPECHY